MGKPIRMSFDVLWRRAVSKSATEFQNDGEQQTVKARVLSDLKFAGLYDGISLTPTSVDELKTISAVADRRLAEFRVGAEKKLSAKAEASVSASSDPPATKVSANGEFLPVMAKVGDRCPKCNGMMSPVGLVNGKVGMICQADRVVLPMSVAP